MDPTALTLVDIYVYPVKSCRGLRLTQAQVDALGLCDDRRFMVVGAGDGVFLTQRSHPRLALIDVTLHAETLTLEAAGRAPLRVTRNATQGTRRVQVWGDAVVADDCGSEAAAWLSDFLNEPARLVHTGTAFHRPVKPAKARPDDVVSFADADPLLLISEASLAELNGRLREPIPMNRFRPNLVVSGCGPFAEDHWTRLRIGDVTVRNSGPCARCVVTTTNQATAERGPEPLRTLATYRRDPARPGNVNFGVNLIHETKTGTLRVGDRVLIEPLASGACA